MRIIAAKLEKTDIIIWQKIFENIALVMYCMIVAQNFLRTTMFKFESLWVTPNYIYIVAYAVIFFRLYLENIGTKNKEKYIKDAIFLAILIVIFFSSFQTNNYSDLKTILICILLLRNIDTEKIVKTFICVVALLMVITVLAALSGIIINLIYTYPESRPRRISFGILYPTDFAAYLVYLSLAWIFIRRSLITDFELILILIAGAVTYFFCDTRTDSAILVFIATLFIIIKWFESRAACRHKKQVFPKWFLFIGMMAYPVCLIFITAVSALYNSDNVILQKLNSVLSNRLLYGHKGIIRYGFKWLGQHIDMNGNGSTTLYYLKSNESFYLDSSYLNIGLRYGILVLIIITIMMWGTTIIAFRRSDYYTIAVLAVLFIHCMIEQHMMQVSYDPFLFLFLADWTSFKDDYIKEKSLKMKWFISS